MKAHEIANKEELIKALRKCGKASADRCWDCDYYDREPWCESALANDAADALEAADKRIAELEAQLPKEGEWIEDEYGYIHCSKCGMEWDEPEHPQTKFCPNCGAKMDGERKEKENDIHKNYR